MKKLLHLIFLLFFLLATGVSTTGAQTPGIPDFNFDAGSGADIKDELEALKETISQLKEEMAIIMAELAEGMKETQEEMRRELESLRGKAKGALTQIMEVIKKEQQTINKENEALKEELKGFKILAETIKDELDTALEGSKLDTKEFLNAMQSAMNESKRQATKNKTSSAKMLDVTKKTSRAIQKDQKSSARQSKSEVLSSLNSAIKTLKVDRKKDTREEKRAKKDAFAAMKNTGRNLKKKSATLRKEVSKRQASLKKNRKKRTQRAEAKDKTGRSKIVRKGARKGTQFASLRKKAEARAAKRIRDAAKSRKGKADAARSKARSKKTVRDRDDEISRLKALEKDSGAGDRQGESQADRALTPEEIAKRKKAAAEQGLLGEDDGLTEEEILLQAQLAADPLLIHKRKLAEFSEQIKKLKRQLASGSKNTLLILTEISKINLQSQRYLGALNSGIRIQLIEYADTEKIILGNFDMAVWTLKSALRLNPEDGNTHFLLAGIFEETHEGAEAIHHAKMAEHWFQKKNQRKKAAEAKKLGQSIYKKFTGKPPSVAPATSQ